MSSGGDLPIFAKAENITYTWDGQPTEMVGQKSVLRLWAGIHKDFWSSIQLGKVSPAHPPVQQKTRRLQYQKLESAAGEKMEDDAFFVLKLRNVQI